MANDKITGQRIALAAHGLYSEKVQAALPRHMTHKLPLGQKLKIVPVTQVVKHIFKIEKAKSANAIPMATIQERRRDRCPSL